MPILPLDYPEPFAATLGVMLYPSMELDLDFDIEVTGFEMGEILRRAK